MKSLGVVRKVDKLRRVAIPVEVREFFKDDEGVIIRKHNPSINKKY